MWSSMFLVGKLVYRQEDVRTLPARPSTSSPLIYLQDSLSSRRFLIDSGASVSVFPDPGSSGVDSGVKLLTVDGSSLSSHSSTIREAQVWVAFSTSSCSYSNPGCRFSETLQPSARCVQPEGFQRRFSDISVHRLATLSRFQACSTHSQPSPHS